MDGRLRHRKAALVAVVAAGVFLAPAFGGGHLASAEEGSRGPLFLNAAHGIRLAAEPDRVVAAADLGPLLENTAAGHLVGRIQGIVCSPTFLCNSDNGHGDPQSTPYMDICDNSSGWTVYKVDLVAGPGASILKAVDEGPSSLVTCGGFFGPTRMWDIEMSVVPVAIGMVAQPYAGDGCYASHWSIHDASYCPQSSTPLDTFGFFWAHGPGVLVSLDLGNGYVMDYFLGNGAHVSYGPGPLPVPT